MPNYLNAGQGPRNLPTNPPGCTCEYVHRSEYTCPSNAPSNGAIKDGWREQPAQGEPRHEARERLDANIKALRRGKPLPHPEGGEARCPRCGRYRNEGPGDTSTGVDGPTWCDNKSHDGQREQGPFRDRAASHPEGGEAPDPFKAMLPENAEPKLDTRIEAGEGMSAEQLAMDILIDYGRDPSLLESRVTKVAEMIERHAALKVREATEEMGRDLDIYIERVAKLREELLQHGQEQLKILGQLGECSQKCRELREERDALKTTNQAREVTDGYILDMRLRAERAESALEKMRETAQEFNHQLLVECEMRGKAESALVEARDKALDEAISTLWVRRDAYVPVSAVTVHEVEQCIAALIALKSKPAGDEQAEQGKERG